MGFVRRYSEINRSAEEEEQKRRPTRKILVHEEGVRSLDVLLGDEDGNEEEKREQGEQAPQSMFPSRGARVSVENLIPAGPRTGAS